MPLTLAPSLPLCFPAPQPAVCPEHMPTDETWRGDEIPGLFKQMDLRGEGVPGSGEILLLQPRHVLWPPKYQMP